MPCLTAVLAVYSHERRARCIRQQIRVRSMRYSVSDAPPTDALAELIIPPAIDCTQGANRVTAGSAVRWRPSFSWCGVGRAVGGEEES